MGKGEIACNEQFLLFPQCFLTIWKTVCQFTPNSKLLSAKSFSLDESKICRLGKGYNNGMHHVSGISHQAHRVPRGAVVKCLTHNPGILGSSCTGSSGFIRGSVLGQDTSEPSLVLVKPRKA